MDAVPERERVVLRYLLEQQAITAPDHEFIRFADGERWTFEQALSAAYGAGHVLAEEGVRRGDRVLVMMGNGPDWLRAWWGTVFGGALLVPVNTAYKGALLEHVVQDADPVIVIADEEHARRIREVAPHSKVVDPSRLLEGSAEPLPLDRPLEPWDLHSVMYTSGTTGPSKGVLTPYFQSLMHSRSYWRRNGPDDTILTDLPLFHAGGIVGVYAHAVVGGRVALHERFSATRYLQTVREVGATCSILVGSMAAYLWSQPERPDDADTSLRWVTAAPLPPDPDGFLRRFGLEEIVSAFSMTEVATPIATRGEPVWGSCGRAWEDMEVRLVDDHDMAVPAGEPGELIVRSRLPWMITPGYLNRPEVTAEAWRNGWFHTGDYLRRDGDGNFFFVDRKKDAIRRRGENISTWEVESVVATHVDVAEVACVAIEDELGDQEVKIFVVAKGGTTIEPEELATFLVPRLPYFMVPRYIELIDELPRTPTNKVRKHELRERGNGSEVFDRVAAGIVVAHTD